MQTIINGIRAGKTYVKETKDKIEWLYKLNDYYGDDCNDYMTHGDSYRDQYGRAVFGEDWISNDDAMKFNPNDWKEINGDIGDNTKVGQIINFMRNAG